MFPIGTYMKEEVRRIAEAAKLPSAHRKDSQGICFLGKIDYNQFIEKYLGRREGPIVELETGRILGHHQGFWFHTIGQRKGLGLSGGPWFVCRKDIDENIIYVSKGYNPEAQLVRDFKMHGFHFITEQPWSDESVRAGVEVKFKIRHVPELTHGRLVREDGDLWHLYSDDKMNGVAPGQFCVIYSPDGRICYGSGEIAW
jgi:tRNA-specific 2-thiouridylase